MSYDQQGQPQHVIINQPQYHGAPPPQQHAMHQMGPPGSQPSGECQQRKLLIIIFLSKVWIMLNYGNIVFLADQWMPKPSGINCPPGLEYLTQIDQILVHQQVEILESE